MNYAAISHSGTSRDCICLEPGHFLFRLRTAKGDIARAVLHYQDKYIPVEFRDTRAVKEMRLVFSDNVTDYWEIDLSFQVVCLRYWFEVTDYAGKRVYYSNYRFSEDVFTDKEDMFDCPQNMREEERFITPKWAENKVLYQVFPSRFATVQPVQEELWYKAPITSRDNLHGDLRGMINHLPHLKELGVDILYMTPLFRSDSCHKYDTIDYYSIDPSFGTEADLKELVDRAHEMGLRVILDGVFNHTSPEFFAFADIKKNEWNSRYLDWYFIEDFPLKANWGEKPNFKTFSYFGGMPKLNVRNPEVSRYILDVALYWLRRCGVDGWRLDVGDEIGHNFWKQFRREIKSEFPDALIIGEVWHYAPDFLDGDEWDTVMNYPFCRSVLALTAEQSMPVSRYAGEMNFLKGNLNPKVWPLLWNLADSHDTPRLLHVCGGDKAKMKLAAALQLLSAGMPMIYYGDEYAMEGGNDPDCRRGMLWDPARQDADMYAYYRRLLSVRRSHPQILIRDAEETADDETGILLRRAESYTLVFNTREKSVSLPAFSGKRDLITEESFSGCLAPYSTAVFSD